jgi:hypothetical protein
MVHFAMFGARGLLRVAATFVGTAAGKRGTLWESEAEAVAHLTALREAQAVAQITAPREAGRV